MALSSRQSRRDVLKLTAYSTAGALLAPSIVRAQTKSLTMMHESSFIPAYDALFKNTIAPAYEKATGIKMHYEMVSVGSLQTRVTTAAENRRRSGYDRSISTGRSCSMRSWSTSATSPKKIGEKGGGWHEAAKETVVVNGKWKAIPFGNIGQLMNYRMDWFRRPASRSFPRPGTNCWRPASN